MTGLAILLGTGLASLWIAVAACTAWMLTHPPRRTYASAVARGRPGHPSELTPSLPFESWTFRSRGRELPVWEIRGDDPSGPVVVFTHGWADSRIGGLVRAGPLSAIASRLILWDLPGHGEAPGTCRLGIAEEQDLEALLGVLKDPKGREGSHTPLDPHPLMLVGSSLGAGISIVVAARHPAGIAGVIAESPYRLPATPARNVLRARALPWRLTLLPALRVIGLLTRAGRRLFSGFDRAAHAARLTCPLLVIHGTEDEVCPIEDGRTIAAAAPSGTLARIEGARHNDLWTDPAHAAACAAHVSRFVRSAVQERGTLEV